ncbi:beta-glucosidase/6-phospho-beta-glucosidase/beta-galactosidase [Opitutaceae bacterium TAV1]|nr:beta-glucosidase/6-phospho-beta-glucosidase/beta-galactosidase [Opitutaceae bacterium TAV1]
MRIHIPLLLATLSLQTFSPPTTTAAPTLPPPPLTATGRDYPLITPGPGEKTLRLTLAANLRATSIRAEIRAYDVNAAIALKILATTTTPIPTNTTPAEATANAATGPRDITLKIDLPRPGLYDITLTALDTADAPLATLNIPYAAVPPRTETGPSDFAVATHFGQTPTASDLESIPASLALIKLAGFSRIRDELSWDTIERTAGNFQFGPHHDAWIRQAAALDLAPLVVLDYGNKRAYPKEFSATKAGFPETPETRALFVRYATELHKRYGDNVHHWEVWNEPHAWGKPTLENYTLLLKDVYAALKKLAPADTIIGCGGGGGGGGPGGDYASAVISHGGLDSMDAFSIHPYMTPPGTPDTGYGAPGSPIGRVSIPAISQHLARFINQSSHLRTDGKKLGLWITEYGAFTSPVGMVQGEPFQALYLSRAYLLARRYGTINVLTWYDFRDDGTNPRNPEHNFGLIRKDYSPKPAYIAAAVLTHTLGDRPWKRAIMENATYAIHEYGEGDDTVIVGWCVQSLYHENVNIRPKPGKYILRDWQGGEQTLDIGEKGYLLKTRPLPQYLIRQK